MNMLLIAAAALLQAAPPVPAEAAPAYANDSAWLCLPGRGEDPCGAPLPTTALNANGYGSVGRSRPAANPPVDCFYDYPTVSRDPQLSSDLQAGPEERSATQVQLARFHEQCRTFAPIYRQVTLAALSPAAPQAEVARAFATAYADVRAAFRQFIATRNRGRPFVLIGHSQGSIHLLRLIQEEIEGRPVAANMVSALLIGWNVEVPRGRDVGGSLRSTPLCRRPGQTGCVVTYVSFRHDAPPPAVGARFGRPSRAGMAVACTNPAALAGGSARLDSYWYAPSQAAAGVKWSSQGTPPTPFLRTEGLATGECVEEMDGTGYLAVRVNADLKDARTDDIPGDVVIGGQRVAGWGLHLADMPLAMGDLMAVVEAQIAAFRARARKKG
jgi:alpha-beta hydrolase superfamily lysophospholipase